MYVHTEYIIRMIKNVKMVEHDKCAAVREEIIRHVKDLYKFFEAVNLFVVGWFGWLVVV